MELLGPSILAVLWCVWFYPFLFRAPHRQNRPSVTVAGPTRIGLALETAAIFLAMAVHNPLDAPPQLWRATIAIALAAGCIVMGWSAVTHLGRQFRLHAGLYDDH